VLEFLFLLVGLLSLGALLAGLWFLFSRTRTSVAPEPLSVWCLVFPRGAEFPLSQAMSWFAALAPLLSAGEPYPYVEWRGEGGELSLHIGFPQSREAALRGQLAAWFPAARLEPLERQADREGTGLLAVLSLRLEKPDLYPLHVPQAQAPDPLLGLLGTLTTEQSGRGVRITWGPPPADWKSWTPAALAAAKAGRALPPRDWRFWLYEAWELLRGTPARPAATAVPELAKAASKARAPVFSAAVTVWARSDSREGAGQRARELASHLRTGFREPEGNALVAAVTPRHSPSAEALRHVTPAMALTAAELASMFHLPSAGHPLVPGESCRRVPPDRRVWNPGAQENGRFTSLGEALTSEGPVPFGLSMPERRLHTYVVGKTGTGKSTLLATLLRGDLHAGRGLGLIDPHGDLAERVLSFVPPERAAQVLYFNPADAEYPVGFNPLFCSSVVERPRVASGVVGVFKKLYGESWGPRLEHFLRNALLALLETSSPSLLLLPRLLTDRGYRTQVLQHVHDPLLRSFFQQEYESYDPRWRAEAISPILNKVGQFLASPVVRHVVGQSGSGFNLRELMDCGGIFIANLASGKIGEDNGALLGGLLVAAFQQAAMARADQPEEARGDFCLYVDEFQHFANDAFAGILSEARKYRLSLTLSHQYLDQLPPGVAGAVFGNVGSLCVFRVGAPDTARLVRELAPSFDAEDLVHLPNHHFCARINRNGETLPAFSARTVPLPETKREIDPLIQESRRRWARSRAAVELEIADLWEGRVG